MYTVYNKHTECNLDVNTIECTLYTINIQSTILMQILQNVHYVCNKHPEYNIDVNNTESTLYTINI